MSRENKPSGEPSTELLAEKAMDTGIEFQQDDAEQKPSVSQEKTTAHQ